MNSKKQPLSTKSPQIYRCPFLAATHAARIVRLKCFAMIRGLATQYLAYPHAERGAREPRAAAWRGLW